MCALKVKTRSCHYYNRVEKYKEHPDIGRLSVVDIEDLVRLGTSHKFCPYFMAKEFKANADILFMPYNYLLDPSIRKSLSKLIKIYMYQVYNSNNNHSALCIHCGLYIFLISVHCFLLWSLWTRFVVILFVLFAHRVKRASHCFSCQLLVSSRGTFWPYVQTSSI